MVILDRRKFDWKNVYKCSAAGFYFKAEPILIYINVMYANITNHIIKFADDTKMYLKLESKNFIQILQRVFNELVSS